MNLDSVAHLQIELICSNLKLLILVYTQTLNTLKLYMLSILFYFPLAFISGASYQHLVKNGNKNWELLPVGGVFSHTTKPECAGYYADVIIHQNSK